MGLFEFFDFTLVAGEVNAWKPDPRIFQEALQRTGSRPDKTLYVGDNYFADVVGSRRAGLRPVLLDPERIFIEADCPVIGSIGDLPGLLAQ
jgi:putative hydrolase of the HAD superfamily